MDGRSRLLACVCLWCAYRPAGCLSPMLPLTRCPHCIPYPTLLRGVPLRG